MVEMRVVMAPPPGESGGAGRSKSRLWDDKGILSLLVDTLRKECRLDPTSCNLEVRNQVAYVQGTVETVAQKQAVARAAGSIPGLKGIVNQLRIAPLSHRSDERLDAEVRASMLKAGLASPLPDSRVINGVAYLSGLLGSLESSKLAEDACWSVPGVEYVVNDIATTSARCAKRVTAKEIEREVGQVIERCLGAAATGVTVDIKGGIVRLRGEVESEHSKFLIEDALRWTPCVVDVVNELAVISHSPN